MHHQKSPPRNEETPTFNGHRGELHEVVYNYAKDDLKIPIHLGKKVVKYFEEGDKAGIELEGSETVSSLKIH